MDNTNPPQTTQVPDWHITEDQFTLATVVNGVPNILLLMAVCAPTLTRISSAIFILSVLSWMILDQIMVLYAWILYYPKNYYLNFHHGRKH